VKLKRCKVSYLSVFSTLLEEEEVYKSKKLAIISILSYFFEFSYCKKNLASFYIELSL